MKTGETVRYVGGFEAGSGLLPMCHYVVTATDVDGLGLIEVREAGEDGRDVRGAFLPSRFEPAPDDIRF
jgi:hypothetical protein